MKLIKSHSVLLCVLLMLCIHDVSAHAPDIPSDNESLETAYTISDPVKSWAIYAELHEGAEAQYYKFDLSQNERLLVMLFVPTSEESSFTPNLVVMGSGITSKDALPEYVEAVEGVGIMLLEAERPLKPTYEPFTPSSYYYLASFDQEVSAGGTHYVAVYEPFQGGRYGLAVGYREEFGIDELIKIPVDVIGIHLWEGQSVLLIFAPLLVTFAIGFVVLFLKRPLTFRMLFGWLGILAGLLYLGSGLMILTQMIVALARATPDFSIVLTMIFALMPILLGIAILRLTDRKKDVTNRLRVYIAIVGVIGLFVWAGLLIGPALALLASLVPTKRVWSVEMLRK
jgi:hypothetical protein